MDSEYYVFSIEYRKGGVGKTTAALNLAKVLLDWKFEVLFLDVDITGTNVSDALDSPFWNTICYNVKAGKKQNRVKQAF